MKTSTAAWVRQACHYILEKSINLYPPEKRAWGRAASAEVHAMPSTFSAARWTYGALWVALRAWLGRLFRRPGAALLGTNTLLRLNWPSLSPLLLALSLCFFLAPQFRQALQATTSMWIAGSPEPGLTQHTFRELREKAQREHDAETLAFLAFHARDRKDALHLAEDAVGIDPGLTWAFGVIPDYEPVRNPAQWAERLERWDPDNAVPYLLHADSLELSAQVAGKNGQMAALAELRAADSPFRKLMQRAFSAPRYDSYLPRHLELERNVMRKHELEQPLLLLEAIQKNRNPNFLHIQNHAEWIVADAKKVPPVGGARPEDVFRQVMRMGQLIESQSETVLGRVVGGGLQQLGGKELLALLRAQGKNEDADNLDYRLQRVRESQRHNLDVEAFLAPGYVPTYRADPFNPGMIIHVAALAFVLALAFVAASLVCLRLRGANEDTRTSLPRPVTAAPLILFSAALALLVAYLPFARIFKMYMFGREASYSIPVRLPNDPEILSSLSNLAYPFMYLSPAGIRWTVGLTCLIVLAVAFYSFRRRRAIPAQA